MKMPTSPVRLLATMGAITFLPWAAVLSSGTAFAQEPTAAPSGSQTASTPAATPATLTPAASAKLPYGVEDIVKLSRAQVSEDVILTYIHNSGTIYNLAPKDIVGLRDQGVSDRVINTMLDQAKTVPQAAAPMDPAMFAAAPTYAYAPAPDYSQPAPTYSPASSVYVIPYPAATTAYYGYYQPYSYGYSGYYGYGYPSVSFSYGYASHYNHYGHYGHYGHYYHHH
jgi:hypothetical protein